MNADMDPRGRSLNFLINTKMVISGRVSNPRAPLAMKSVNLFFVADVEGEGYNFLEKTLCFFLLLLHD